MTMLRENLAVKFLAACLCIVCALGTMAGCVYCIKNWDGLFHGADYFDSSQFYDTLWEYRDKVERCIELCLEEELNYLQREDVELLAEQLGEENTNFRFTVRDSSSGAVLWSNTGGKTLEELEIGNVHVSSREASVPDAWLAENEAPFPIETPLSGSVIIEYSVAQPLTVKDAFFEGELHYTGGEPFFVGLTLAAAAATLVLVIFLCCCAGHKKGVEGIHRNWQDRIPYDLYLFGLFWAIFGSLFLASEVLWYLRRATGLWEMLWYLAFLIPLVAVCLAGLLTTVTRIKSRTLLRNTIIWRVCAFAGKGIIRGVRSLPLIWRFVVGLLAYLALNAYLSLLMYSTLLALVLLVLLNGVVLVTACRWLLQWRTIRKGTAVILQGDTEAQIDTGRMFSDLREHADQLNDLGSAVNKAVDARMRSERFKAELITNVSHDLKTPLTSIINYVDLLKKVEIENETAKEYLEVLDRKSQRLKKLTEDLVEASKASTGTLPVSREKLGATQLVSQAAGEYTDRLSANRLELITTLPEEELYVWADGRHLWRVLDNLLSNCCKYALPGTRVYLDARGEGESVILTLKNVSRDPLNVPAEQLLARFVRGDEARSTEGSGLGLSIAQSLTELQGGLFTLTVDGDFFKVEVALARAGAIRRENVL